MSRTGRSKSPESPSRFERGTRSYTMSRIRGKDTSIEVMVRRYLFSRGLRFRKNDRRYPGHPDVVLPKWHAVVFVNGCFWHMHEGCARHTMPKSNVEFWTAKLMRNRERDEAQHRQLQAMGWRVIVVWECELGKRDRRSRLERLYEQIVGGSIDGSVDDGAGGTGDGGPESPENHRRVAS
nr:very short patch repair endonuclease [Bifidobacterium margollesii]